MKKVLYGVLMLGWIPTLAVVAGAQWTDALFAQGRTPLKVTRIYTGPDGKTKAEEITLPMKPRDGGSELTGSIPVTNLQFRHTTPAYNLDWHPAPRRQLVDDAERRKRDRARRRQARCDSARATSCWPRTRPVRDTSRALSKAPIGSRSTSRWPRARRCRSNNGMPHVCHSLLRHSRMTAFDETHSHA